MMTARVEPEASAIERRRKRQILRVVARVVAEDGFDGATMRKIAERAGVSTGMLTYYYKSKRDLIMDMLTDSYDRFVRHIGTSASESGGAARIEAVFQQMLEGSRSGFFPFSFWLAFWAEAARDEDLRRFSARSPIRELFKHSLEVGIAAGELRNDLDVDLAADLVTLVTQGARVAVALEEMSEVRVSQVLRLLMSFLDANVNH